MLDAQNVKTQLRGYILTQLVRRPDYPLADDEPIVSGGLIDSFSLAQIAVFIEETFGVYLPDNELTVDQMDTLSQMTTAVLAKAA